MVKIQEYQNNYRQSWFNFVDSIPSATIAHQLGWKNVMERGLGHKPIYLMARDGDRVVGILPLALVRTWWNARYLISLPWIDYGGICADNADIFQSLNNRAGEIAREYRAAFVEYRSPDSYNLDLSIRQDKVTFRLNLHKDYNVLWNGFDAKLRNQIRKAEKSGLYTELGGLEALPQFYKIFQWKMRDLGTPVWGYKFFETILQDGGARHRSYNLPASGIQTASTGPCRGSVKDVSDRSPTRQVSLVRVEDRQDIRPVQRSEKPVPVPGPSHLLFGVQRHLSDRFSCLREPAHFMVHLRLGSSSGRLLAAPCRQSRTLGSDCQARMVPYGKYGLVATMA